jgi:hypothetical protein
MIVSDTLCAELEQVLHAYFGAPRRVVQVMRHPCAYASSFPIDELTVRLENGRELAIVRKDLSASAILPAARGVKPRFLYDPMREIEAYRKVAAPSRSGARLFGAIVDPTTDCYVLYLEKIDGTLLSEIGEFAVWRAAARWLAAFHARWSDGEQARAVVQSEHFLHYDLAFFGRWLQRAGSLGRARYSHAHQALDRVLRTYADNIDRLVGMAQTVLHGEFYASNILIESSDGRVCPVDWELAALGPPLVDLAALIAGRWADAQKENLARTYFAALPSATCKWESFLRDLDLCRLHLAVQWLGWSRDWTPPAEHAHDWLSDGVLAAERLNATG